MTDLGYEKKIICPNLYLDIYRRCCTEGVPFLIRLASSYRIANIKIKI